jgi:hypothetical protein
MGMQRNHLEKIAAALAELGVDVPLVPDPFDPDRPNREAWHLRLPDGGEVRVSRRATNPGAWLHLDDARKSIGAADDHPAVAAWIVDWLERRST